MAKKASTKGTNPCFLPPTPIDICSLDSMAAICGFSLGQEESVRLANISLIEAKEEAFLALQKTKQKLTLSSENKNDSDIRVLSENESSGNTGNSDARVLSENESSVVMTSPALEWEGTSANHMLDLSPIDQG